MSRNKAATSFHTQVLLSTISGLLLGCEYEPASMSSMMKPPDLSATVSTCNAGNCLGCCYNGACQAGNSNSGCGSGGDSCRVCVEVYHEICLPRQQRCDLDPNGSWRFTVTAASIATLDANNRTWDGGASMYQPPDPYIKINNTRISQTIDDSFSPRWQDAGVTLTANSLISTGVSVEILDFDVTSSDDTITGPRQFRFQPNELNIGSVTIADWGQATSVSFGFSKLP